MHPFLNETAHPLCVKEADALRECHTAHSLLKFVGYCNSVRHKLDDCLNAEFEVMRKANADKAAAEKARLEERKRKLQSSSASSPSS
jgi:hypothetical protein